MKNSIEYYLSKGFDQRSAEYFASGRKRIIGASADKNFTLMLSFDNGETRRLDMKPIIEQGTVFAFLSDPKNFSRVYLDNCHSVCWDKDPNMDSETVWENKVDLCPDACYMDSVSLGGDTVA